MAAPVDLVLVVALAFLVAVLTVLLAKRIATAAPAGGLHEADRGCCWLLLGKAAGADLSRSLASFSAHVRRPAAAMMPAAGWISALVSVLDSPPPPDAGPIAEGTKLRVSYGDGFEGRGANWAVRIRSNPTLNNREGRVLGHVRNGQTLTATGRTEREFVHVRFKHDKVGWMAMHWEGYKMVEVLDDGAAGAQEPPGEQADPAPE